jgi:hypothetical protein
VRQYRQIAYAELGNITNVKIGISTDLTRRKYVLYGLLLETDLSPLPAFGAV